MQSIEQRTHFIKATAGDLGFDFCGISKAGFLEEDAPRLENWLNQNMHGEMSYMANHFDKRLDPSKLVPGAKSVISLMFNYYPEKDFATNDGYKIAKYAYGEDYHFVVKRKLKDFMELIRREIGEVEGRVFVDSAPVMERSWAAKSGLGWIGKHSLLINKNMGSFFFLAEIILDLELEYDHPIKDYCGTCTRCIEACPTDAIPKDKIVDANKCISYLTIELKNEIPTTFKNQYQDWVFGCDICQDVCPWNRFAQRHKEEAFKPSSELESLDKRDWEEMTQEVFSRIFKGSPVKRTKHSGLKRNIKFVNPNQIPE